MPLNGLKIIFVILSNLEKWIAERLIFYQTKHS